MITYTIAIDKNDNGNFADSGDAITPDVLEVRWRLGMAQPYDSLSAPMSAQITVRNPAGAYSPEQSGLMPGRRVRIQSNDGTTTRTHFIGYIHRIDPLPGEQGSRTAVLEVRGIDGWLAENIVRPQALVNVRADEVIDAVLSLCKLRYPVLAGYLIIGNPAYFYIGNLLFGDALARNFEAGVTVFAYTGDMWAGGVPADVAIQQYAMTERGRFFIDREGTAVFHNRHHTVLDTTIQAAFDNSMDGLEYSYGAEVVNLVEVRVTPRSVGEPDSLLWTLAEPQKLSPGVTKSIVARYQDSSENPPGALLLSQVQHAAFLTADGSGTDLTPYVLLRVIQPGASAAVLEVENTYHRSLYLTELRLYGTPLIQGDSAVVTEQDAGSQTFYGLSRLTLDLPALTSIEEAASLAAHEVLRRRNPRGTVRMLHTSTVTHPEETLCLTLFDRITLTESQTGSDSDYFIIAEDHHIDQGGQRHRVSWLLEPAPDDAYFVVGEHMLDGTHYPVY